MNRVRAAVLVVVVGLALASGAATAGPPRALALDGVSLRLPAGWHGKLAMSRGNVVLRVANLRLHTLVVLSEVGNRPGTSGFDPVAVPIRIRTRDVVPATRDHLAARRHFAVSGRSLALLVYLGRRTRLAQSLRAANVLLRSVRVEPYAHPGTWTRLRRPLHLPSLTSGASCPRSRSGRAAPSASFTLGSGPAYPVFGTNDGVAALSEDKLRAGAYWHKTLWAISPRYRGAVLVRGRRIDGTGMLGFAIGLRPASELRFPPERFAPKRLQAKWRYGPTATVIPRRGCYALQIDGSSFSRVLVFSAR
ncbi:MAG TPA: hypothetical protein VJU80_13210 [Solirubrobacteraceae bacterium]|nr:hypothetical protein [Solirubrobacteraceae bacterium]